ncbi:MAG: TetR/AcrR family transcriptional regulator [Alcanivorax sp.]|nr:TetR/AcrR family transcriptional regulator [Alcanivorax sp.]
MRKHPRQKRSQALVNKLIDAAGDVIVERGLTFTTTNHIADRAGVDIASLYQYFENKEDVIEELLKRLSSEMIDIANGYFGSIEMYQATPAELIRGALSLGLGIARQKPAVLELAQHPGVFFSSHGILRLETYLQEVATAYFTHHFRSYPITNLHTRLHIVSRSAITLLARHLADEALPHIDDAEFVEAMVALYAPYFDNAHFDNAQR